jgi:hypothetical protein
MTLNFYYANYYNYFVIASYKNPPLDIITGVLWVLGLSYTASRLRDKRSVLLLLLFIAGFVPACLSDFFYPQIERLTGLFPFIFLFAGVGLDRFLVRPLKLPAWLVLLIIFPIYLQYHAQCFFVERQKDPVWKSDEMNAIGRYFLRNTGQARLVLPPDMPSGFYQPETLYYYLGFLRNYGQIDTLDMTQWPLRQSCSGDSLFYLRLLTGMEGFLPSIYPHGVIQEIKGWDGTLWGYAFKTSKQDMESAWGLSVKFRASGSKHHQPENLSIENPFNPGPQTPENTCFLRYKGYCYLDAGTYTFYTDNRTIGQECNLKLDGIQVIWNGGGTQPASFLTGWHECELSYTRHDKKNHIHLFFQGKDHIPREFTASQFTHVPLGQHGFFLEPLSPAEGDPYLFYYQGGEVPGAFKAQGSLWVEQPGEYEFSFQDFPGHQKLQLDGKLAAEFTPARNAMPRLVLKAGKHTLNVTTEGGFHLIWHRVNEPWQAVPYLDLTPGSGHVSFARQLAGVSGVPASQPVPQVQSKERP